MAGGASHSRRPSHSGEQPIVMTQTQPLTHPKEWMGFPRSWRRPRQHEWRNLRIIILLVDILMIAITFGLAYFIRFSTDIPLFYTPESDQALFYSTIVFWLIPIWIGIFALYRLYDFNNLLGGMDEYIRIVQAATISLMTVIMLSFLDPTFIIARGWLLLTWIFTIVFGISGRFFVRHFVYTMRNRGMFVTPVIIIGANEEGRAIAEHLHETPIAGARVIGFLDNRLREGSEFAPGLRVLGPINSASECVARYAVSEVIVIGSALNRAELLDLYQVFGLRQDVTLRLSSGLFELLTTGMRVKDMGSVPLLSMNRLRLSRSEQLVKKMTDLVVATLALIILSPLMIVLSILIKLDAPGPIIHRRRVLGTGGKEFDAFKFRTMYINGDEILQEHPEVIQELEQNMKAKDDPRVTKIGQFIRKLSLDELPQLFNVLLGQMSMVGPRMITPDESNRYSRWRLNLLTVKPGITGMWQVSGRSDISYPERIRIDMNYIRNYSLWLDLVLLARTIPAVLKKTGAY